MRMRQTRIVALLALALFLAPRAAVAPHAQAAGTLRLYIARHGETDWNLTHRLPRASESLALIRREHPSGNVLIVSHRITNQMILRALMDLTPEQAVKIVQDNDEVYLVELDPGVK